MTEYSTDITFSKVLSQHECLSLTYTVFHCQKLFFVHKLINSDFQTKK